MMTLTFYYSVDYDEAVGNRISQDIRAQKHQTEPEYFDPDGNFIGQEGLNLTLRDEEGTLIGALVGYTVFGALHVHWIWVDKPHRRQGFARDLFYRAFAIARERGCTYAWWDTYTLLGAYKMFDNLGAKVVMEMKDYPPGSALRRYRLDFDQIDQANLNDTD